jgi:hypothetical protein
MKASILLAILIISIDINAQQVYFHKTYYEGTQNSLAVDILRLDNGNYLLSGNYDTLNSTTSLGYEYINLLDEHGNVLDSSILPTEMDSLGNLSKYYWHHYFAKGFNGEYYSFLSVATPDEGYNVATKYNSNGDTVYTTELHSHIRPLDTVNKFTHYLFNRAIPTLDNGLAIVGQTSTLNFYKSGIIKLDSMGNEEWTFYMGTDSSSVIPSYTATGITQLPDSSYIISFFSNEGYIDRSNHIYIKKLDKNGQLIKTKVIGSGESNLIPRLQYNPKDGFIYMAYDKEYWGDDIILPSRNYHKVNLMKLDQNLNIIWNKYSGKSLFLYLGREYHPNYGIHDFIIDEEGNFTILGDLMDLLSVNESTHLKFLLRLDPNGDSLWFKAYDFLDISGNTFATYPYGKFVMNADKGFTIATNIQIPNSNQAALVFRVDSNGCPDINCSVAAIEITAPQSHSVQLFPNPVVNEANFHFEEALNTKAIIEIYNSLGSKVDEIIVEANTIDTQLNVSQYANGIYIYSIIGNNGVVQSGKFVKQ